MLSMAFDIGGTFTDFVLYDDRTETVYTLKVASTPDKPERAVLSGISDLLAQGGVAAGDVDRVLHATTVATNAVLERKGAATGLITTEGFRDVLIIGRQKRYETYDLYLEKPRPLVQRRHIKEVRERLDHQGGVVSDLDDATVDLAIDAMIESDRKAVAVCLMHAYANGTHEQRIATRLKERAPELSVSLSSDVSPRYREYERTSTTVANAYIRPIVERYIAGLQQALNARGFERELHVMQSSGGLVSPSIARAYPVRIIESGPAAGVLMGAIVGRSAGFGNLLTFDMGGTTAKLGAVDDGQPAIMPTFEIDHVSYKKGSGLPVNVPAVELLEIGAGGGSIARVDMGMIAIGPQSAGADPGPMCYGMGGTEPTITDANVVLGYLDPNWFNGGAMSLDAAAAARGIEQAIGTPLGLERTEAAWGVHLVATGNMESAMRIVSVERGRDPRGYTMVAFGGAGPLHASRLARAVGVPTVIVPSGAGVGSAVGLLAAEPRIDVSTTRVLRLEGDCANEMSDIYTELEQRATSDLAKLNPNAAPRWSRYAYMRYAGQGFEVHVDLPDGPIGPGYHAKVIERFNQTYFRRHRFLDPGTAIEAVDWTLVATLATDSKVGDLVGKINQGTARPRREGSRKAYFPESGGMVETAVYDRQSLSSEQSVSGPAIIEDPDCTALVLPGDTARLDPFGHLVIDVASQENGP